ELTALRQIVINALGLKPLPGQSPESLVSLQEVSFQGVDPVASPVAAVSGESRIQSWFEVLRPWAAIVGAGVILLVFLRMLSKMKPEPVPVEVLSLKPVSGANSLSNPQTVTPELLNELIRQKPAHIGV